jgi:hypothetical protein
MLRDNPTPETAQLIYAQNVKQGFTSPGSLYESPPSSSTIPQHRKFQQRHSISGAPLPPTLYHRPSFQPPALVNDLAKNVLDRAEALGINKAVKDTIGELRKNVGYYQQALASNSPELSSPSAFPQGVASLPFRSAQQQQAKLAAELRTLKASNADCATALSLATKALEEDGLKEQATVLLKHVQEVLAGNAVFDSTLLTPLRGDALSPAVAPPSPVISHASPEVITPVYLPSRPNRPVATLPRVPLAARPAAASQKSPTLASSPSPESSPLEIPQYPPVQKRTVYSPGPTSSSGSSTDPLGVNRT